MNIDVGLGRLGRRLVGRPLVNYEVKRYKKYFSGSHPLHASSFIVYSVVYVVSCCSGFSDDIDV